MPILDKFMTASLNRMANGGMVAGLLLQAIESADPERAVYNNVRRNGDCLIIQDRIYNLRDYRNVYVVGAGKASPKMAKAVAALLGDCLEKGMVISKNLDIGDWNSEEKVDVIQGSHPVPDERSVKSAQHLYDFLCGVQAQDQVICLLSGGASALMMLPIDGIPLADIQEMNRQLLACGATINEINTVRKHLDKLKGGRLSALVYPAHVASLILSDVVGDRLDIIASGPTTADPATCSDALGVLQKYGLMRTVAGSIRKMLDLQSTGNLVETIKPGDQRLRNTQNFVIGSNELTVQKVVEVALHLGLRSQILTTTLQGEARQAGVSLAEVLKMGISNGIPFQRPFCLVAGGETTVTVHGQGKGGRNQELALGAVDLLDGLDNVLLVTLATDGEDGPTDAAGAVVTGDTARLARQMGMRVVDYLENNNAYEFFDRLGDLIRIGPTGTNVNDLVLLFAF
jgi:glycerate 2-kinase